MKFPTLNIAKESIAKKIRSIPGRDTAGIFAAIIMSILATVYAPQEGTQDPKASVLKKKEPSIKHNYGEEKEPQKEDQLCLEKLEYFEPLYQFVSIWVDISRKKSLALDNEEKKEESLRRINVVDLLLSSWRKLHKSTQENTKEIKKIERQIKRAITKADTNYSGETLANIFPEENALSSDSQKEDGIKKLTLIYKFLRKNDTTDDMEEIIKKRIELYLFEYRDIAILHRLYPHTNTRNTHSIKNFAIDEGKLEKHKEIGRIYGEKNTNAMLQTVMAMGFNEKHATQIIENIPKEIKNIEKNSDDPTSMTEENITEEVGEALAQYFRRVILNDSLIQKRARDPLEDLYVAMSTSKDNTKDHFVELRKDVNKLSTEIEILYGIKTFSEDRRIDSMPMIGLDLIRMKTLLENLKRSLSIYPPPIIEVFRTKGVYIVIASKIRGAAGYSRENKIAISYTHDTSWSDSTTHHEVTHCLDNYDTRNTINIETLELMRENGSFDALNMMMDYYEGAGSISIKEAPGSARGYGLTNVNEDEASLGEYILQPEKMAELVNKAYLEYKKGPENPYQKTLKWKIEAMTGCELDLGGDEPKFKKEWNQEEYVQYFEKEMGKKIFSQKEYFSFWSQDSGGKQLMDNEFWNALLQGKTPVWEGARYIYLD